MTLNNPVNTPAEEKNGLHPRNKHRSLYDFRKLTKVCPELKHFVVINKYKSETIDFTNASAVKLLNQALLKSDYHIEHWDIPANYLCPPIPGRADYIHNMADILGSSNGGKIPLGKLITVLDVGTGANCIYPLIGNKEYGWNFIGSDIDPLAVKVATQIVNSNERGNSIEAPKESFTYIHRNYKSKR